MKVKPLKIKYRQDINNIYLSITAIAVHRLLHNLRAEYYLNRNKMYDRSPLYSMHVLSGNEIMNAYYCVKLIKAMFTTYFYRNGINSA